MLLGRPNRQEYLNNLNAIQFSKLGQQLSDAEDYSDADSQCDVGNEILASDEDKDDDDRDANCASPPSDTEDTPRRPVRRAAQMTIDYGEDSSSASGSSSSWSSKLSSSCTNSLV